MNKLIIGFTFLLFFTCCQKGDGGEGSDTSQPLVFSTLKAEKETIASGEKTKVTATASGYKISYTWVASLGDILGSGSSVEYAASPCSIGKITISCTVKDGNNHSQLKEVYIVVN